MARRFKNEPIKTVSAWAQARSARVPLVVVMTIVLPRTFSGRNSRGELPKSKSMPPVWSAPIRNPLRSPASNTSGLSSLMASASGISPAGMIASAPLASAVIMEVVARRISSTTHVVRPSSRWLSAEDSAGENNTSMLRVIRPVKLSFVQFCVNPRVVKQVLLRVTRMGPEMGRREFMQSLQRDVAPRKIKPPQRLHHPDIHRKCVLKSVGKQQNAIGNLSAHTRQPNQRISRFADRQGRKQGQSHRAVCNHFRRRAQIGRAKTHFASPQFGFASRGNATGQRKTINRRMILWNKYLFTEPLAQPGDDLLNLHDLLAGGENERRQAFPRVLSHQPQ